MAGELTPLTNQERRFGEVPYTLDTRIIRKIIAKLISEIQVLQGLIADLEGDSAEAVRSESCGIHVGESIRHFQGE